MIDTFEFLRVTLKPIFKWIIPPFWREKIIYPCITYFAKPLTVPRPRALILELSNTCNLQCKMCTRPPKGSPAGNMDPALAKAMLQAAYDCDIKNVGFHTIGEPLLYPYLREVLIFAKRLGFPITISANANLLTPEKSDMLLDIGINHLRISLEGTNSTYNSIRQGGDFTTVIKNIEYFYNKRKDKNDPLITCHYVLTKDTVKSVKDFQERCGYLFSSVLYCPAINQGHLQNEYVLKNSIILLKNDRYPCVNLWTNMYITFNGDVSMCCVDYSHKLIVGNVKDGSLLDIWNSDAYRYYRKLNREGKINRIEFCNNCTMPVLSSTFYMSRMANFIRRQYNLKIKILNRH